MAAGDIALRIVINATNNTGGIIADIGKGLMGLAGSGPLGAVAAAAVVAGVAIVGVGVASAKAAGDFQQSMSLLVTSAGESKSAIGMVSDGILKMSVDTGTSTKQLGAGMYYVESAGYHAADAIKVMGVVAMGAKTENADLATVAKAVTTVMTDYHMKAGDAAKAMNGLIATVQNGKTSLQDLSSSMGAVLPIASALGIKFPQVAGAMDTMTNAGMPARQAAMNLAHVLVALSAPSAVAVKSMKEVGLSAQGVKDALVNQGLPQALQMIEDHVGQKFPKGSVAYETALKNILGGLVGFKLAAQLTGDSLKTTEANIAKVTAAMNDNSGAVMGWDIVQKNLNFQLDRVKEAFGALLIVIGQKLLPIITPAVKAFADFLSAIIGFVGAVDKAGAASNVFIAILEAFGMKAKDAKKVLDDIGKFLSEVFTPVWKLIQEAVKSLQESWNDMVAALKKASPEFEFLAKVLGGILLFALKAIIELIAVVLIAAIIIVVNALKLLMFIIEALAVALHTYGDAIRATAQAGQDAGKAFLAFWESIPKMAEDAWKAVVKFAEDAWKKVQSIWGAIGKWFEDRGNDISKAFQTGWANVVKFAQSTWDTIKKDAQKAWAAILAVVIKPVQDIGAIFQWLYDHNKYIKALCDAIHKDFDDVIKWAQQQWDKFSKWIVGLWQSISKSASDTWKTMGDNLTKSNDASTKQIQEAWNTTSKALSDSWKQDASDGDAIWKSISDSITKSNEDSSKSLQKTWGDVTTWLSSKWAEIAKGVSDLWGNIGAIFSGAWSQHIKPGLDSIGQGISQTWAGLVKGAEDFGKNFVAAIAKGIKDGAGAIGKAIHDAMASALGALGFVNVPGFAGGVQNFQGGWAIVGERGPELMFLPSGASVIPSGNPPPVASGSSSAPGGNQPMIIYNILDGKQISKVVTTYQVRELRIQGVVRGA